jgi:hypothetical protein
LPRKKNNKKEAENQRTLVNMIDGFMHLNPQENLLHPIIPSIRTSIKKSEFKIEIRIRRTE